MPVCSKCNAYFPNWTKIEGKMCNLKNRKFCLECSPFGKHNTKDLLRKLEPDRTCPRCGKTLPRSQFYNRRGVAGASVYCKQCTNAQTLEITRRIKKEAVAYKGGKCEVCKYSRYFGAMQFHHRDPSKKDFCVSQRRTVNLDEIKPELDKCALVCSRCHDEIEGGIIPCPGLVSPAGFAPAT